MYQCPFCQQPLRVSGVQEAVIILKCSTCFYVGLVELRPRRRLICEQPWTVGEAVTVVPVGEQRIGGGQ
jgi:hypothetical protein